MKALSREVLGLYRGLGLKTRLYTALRWRLCPIEKIAAHVPAECRLLDLGCGVGMLSNFVHLRDPRARVLGVDLSGTRIATAKKTVGGRRGIEFQEKNALELGPEETFDTVTMTDFLHHLTFAGQEELVRFLFERLPRGGRLVMLDVVESPAWKRTVADRLDRLLNHGEVSNFRSLDEWRVFLEGIGFQVETHRADEGLPLADAIFVARK